MESAVLHLVDQICWLKGEIALGTVFHVETKKKLRIARDINKIND